MRKKNQISKYYASSPKGLMKKIYEQSMNKKPPNPVGY